jgi:hypothetical protein
VSDINTDNVSALNNKLTTFMAGLTPGEQRVMGSILQAAHDTLGGSDVAGYDAGDQHDLLTKINWDGLTTMSVTPGQIADRNIGGANN